MSLCIVICEYVKLIKKAMILNERIDFTSRDMITSRSNLKVVVKGVTSQR